MAMKKITRRWLVNGLGVIFVILLGVMIAFSFGVRSFYYSSVQQIILSRSSVISTARMTAVVLEKRRNVPAWGDSMTKPPQKGL